MFSILECNSLYGFYNIYFLDKKQGFEALNFVSINVRNKKRKDIFMFATFFCHVLKESLKVITFPESYYVSRFYVYR